MFRKNAKMFLQNVRQIHEIQRVDQMVWTQICKLYFFAKALRQ